MACSIVSYRMQTLSCGMWDLEPMLCDKTSLWATITAAIFSLKCLVEFASEPIQAWRFVMGGY